jgi:formylglycine-generating enzyme required for sulfatase activity
VHALVDPNAPSAVSIEALETRAAAWDRYSQQMEVAERHFQSGQWQQARDAFRAALKEKPGEQRARRRLEACERRLRGTLPGFGIVGEAYDEDTGLPREVRVSGLGIPMVLVAGSEFEMGSEKFPSATPVHTIRVEPFYLAKYELTQAEWQSVVGDGKSPRADRTPIHEVSWEDIQVFLQTVNRTVAGGGFRLPTEAEWEYAAGAGATDGEELAKVAWFGDSEETGAPHPVGTKEPDRLGLFDMRGNVWEWCSSLSKPYPYDATDGRESPNSAGQRVLRGGGYADPADLLDPRLRHAERPNRRLRWNGMRLARSVPEI